MMRIAIFLLWIVLTIRFDRPNDRAARIGIIPKANRAGKCRQARGGECRVVVCDPKLYKCTARGRKRREKNDFNKKGESRSRNANGIQP